MDNLTDNLPKLEQAVFIKNMKKPFALAYFFVTKIPTLLWWGVKVKKMDSFEAIVVLPFSQRSKNPFKSIYFAAQSGAAELASGLLVTMATAGMGSISTLVTEVSGTYSKKANQTVFFTCSQGEELRNVVSDAVQTQTPKTFQSKITGTFSDGTLVSLHLITWSIKSR